MASIVEVISYINRLEPFPGAAVRVLELSLDGAERSELAKVVAEDPGLTAKVLKLSNSAQYAPRVPIDSIFEAVNRLGSQTIASIAMTNGCASFFMGYGSSDGRSNRVLWEECLHTALVARHLAPLMSYENPELAYTVGLLQNVGHIILDRFLNDARDAMIALVGLGMPITDAEKTVLGIDHAGCGGRIARRWGFPDSLTMGILHHHTPEKTVEFRQLCQVAKAADEITAQAMINKGPSILDRPDQAPNPCHGLTSTELATLLVDVRADLYETDLALS